MKDDAERKLPLDGVRVVDLADGAGSITARYLGDLGAEVIRVEPPDGAPSRRAPEADVRHLTRNSNKLGITLDLEDEHDRATLLDVLATTDILVDDHPPGHWEPIGLAADDLGASFPALVILSVTPFGQTGPQRSWVATDRVHAALGGFLARSGIPGLPPLLPPGELPTACAAMQALYVVLLAYYRRLVTGVGDFVDLSIHEATAQAIDPGFGMGGGALGGASPVDGPRGRPDALHLYPIFPCLDGHVRICMLSPRQWRGMWSWLGEPTEFAGDEYEQLMVRYAAKDRLHPAIAELVQAKTRDSLVEEGARHGVPIAGLNGMREVLDSEHFRERNSFASLALPDGRLTRVPNGFVDVDGARAGIRFPAPRIGEHQDDVLAALPSRTAAAPAEHLGSAALPLEGIRVLDLGVIIVGAEVGRLLADQGAEVIKVENRAFPDGARTSFGGEPMSPSFARGNRNKLALGVNLRSDDGRALFLQLVARSDVVLSNFKPGTMESLGLDHATLLAANPRIVVIESSGMGSSGPWSKRMGYGPLMRCLAGITQLWRYPEIADSFSDAATAYPDHITGRVGAASALAGLIGRQRSGRGVKLSNAQVEIVLANMSDEFALESLQPGTVVPQGNNPPGDAPRGVYPCAGDDEWCVVDIRGDDDWAALCKAIDRPELASDPSYASAGARVEARSQIDELVSAWTCLRDPRASMEELQAVGVPAGMMQRYGDFVVDPQLTARGFLTTQLQPEIDVPLQVESGPAHFLRIPPPEVRPAPMPAADSRTVCRRVLGLSDVEIDALVAAGVLEERDR